MTRAPTHAYSWACGTRDRPSCKDVLKYDGVALRGSVPQIRDITPPAATATPNDATIVELVVDVVHPGDHSPCRAASPTTYITGVMRTPTISGSMPVWSHSHQVRKAASTIIAACARLMHLHDAEHQA